MFERILVATDGSANARRAVEQAAGVASMASSNEVVLLHVCSACNADLDPAQKHLEIAENIVKEGSRILEEAGVPVRSVVEEGYPPEAIGSAITDIATREEVDLIVIGSRGLTEFKGMLLGSVSNKVVHNAPCPVLVVKD